MDRRNMILGLGVTLVSTRTTPSSGQGAGNPAPDPDPSTPVHFSQAVGNLVLNSDLTKISTGSGNWSDASTWWPTGVPGAGDRVLINAGDMINYDISSAAALGWVRVDGELTFSSSVNTKLVIDTLDVSVMGRLTIGTAATPIPANITAEIVIADNGAIDLSYDPFKFSRGIIVEGTIVVYGASLEPFFKVDTAPVINDTSVVLNGTAVGWQVGDTIIVGATKYEGYHYDNGAQATIFFGNEDEERIITSISTTHVVNDTINFSGGLIFNHRGPASRPELKTYVGNYTRNVKFSTENSASVPIHQRGHYMNMGPSASVNVRYLEAYELGRTDKSKTSIEAADVVGMAATTNVRGRYAMHCHHMGLGAARRRNPPVFVGNAIYGSPGWGMVQHFSTGNWYNNVAYGCFGAAFVSEAGNESGTWRDNLAIFCQGKNWGTPKGDDYLLGDTGGKGDGFHMVGRMVRCKGNVAISCNQGITFFHRLVTTPPGTLDSSQYQIPGVLRLETGVDRTRPSIHYLVDNEVIACNRGLFIEKSNPNQKHDFWTLIERLLAWNVLIGSYIAYTSKYVMKDFDLVALDTSNIPTFNTRSGFEVENNWYEMVLQNPRIEGFRDAIKTTHSIVNPGNILPSSQNLVVLDPTLINNQNSWTTFDDTTYGDVLFATAASLPGNAFSLETTEFIDGTDNEIYSGISFNVDLAKTDGIGVTELFQANGNLQQTIWRGHDIARYLAAKGYYTDAANSNRYLIIPMWFTDRLTAETHCFGMKLTLHANRNLGAYTNNGNINSSNVAPTVANITGQTAATAVIKKFDLIALSGAADSNGDTPTILAVDRTENADTHDNGDGTIDYVSDFGFTGDDTFDFWVQDGHGGVTKATCTITVS